MSNVAKLKKRALDFEQKKQFDKALDAYMQVLGALGDHVEEGDVALFNRVGDLLLRQGNVSAAVDHYERAVDLYTDGGFHNNAIALCSKILRNAPGRNSIYYKLGRISAKKGFTSDAKSNFLEYADRMQRIGHVEEAFRALKEFADLCPDQDDIRLMLAEQLVRGNRKAEAIEQLQLLYEKYEAEGRTQEANATLERMTAIDPSYQPKRTVSRPSPKANDLIFLDVNFDAPEAPPRSVTDRVPVVPSAGVAPGAGAAAPATAEAPGRAAAGERLPLIEAQEADTIEIAPVDGLSSGAIFDAGAAASGSHERVSQMNAEPIAGFEETSLGVMDQVSDGVAPLPGLEQPTPFAGGTDHTAGLSLDTELPPPTRDAHSTPAALDGGASDDSLELLDISLDLIDDGSPDSGDGLTFVFPEEDAVHDVAGSAPANDFRDSSGARVEDAVAEPDGGTFSTDLPQSVGLPGPAGEEIRIEPLLQLPELDPADGPESELGQAQDLPLISQGDDPFSELDFRHGDDAIVEDDASSPAAELRFLDVDSDSDLPAISRTDESGALRWDTAAAHVPARGPASEPEGGSLAGASAASAAGEAGIAVEPTLDDLRTIADLNPDDGEARRRLAEALLEAGDRDGGLAELDAAMFDFERMGDLRSAIALVHELIRVEPHAIRYHQKRVEYAVRANDRSLLAEGYFSLAENLFQMGEVAKSRAVYARVLELIPGDPRARAALQAIDDATNDPEPAAEPAPVPRSTNGTAAAQRAAPPFGAPAASTPATLAAVPRARDREPEPASAASDYVNLADWLSEETPARNTRMVVDVKEPEIQEQVDFTEMLDMFKQGVAANVDEADHEAHYDLGVAYKEMGLLDEAISEFQKALRGTGNRARTYEALGQSFVERGQHQIAVTILSRALGDKSYTDDMLVGVLYLLGYASEALGRWADAQRFYERVFAVDIEFRDIATRLAVAERAGK